MKQTCILMPLQQYQFYSTATEMKQCFPIVLMVSMSLSTIYSVLSCISLMETGHNVTDA